MTAPFGFGPPLWLASWLGGAPVPEGVGGGESPFWASDIGKKGRAMRKMAVVLAVAEVSVRTSESDTDVRRINF